MAGSRRANGKDYDGEDDGVGIAMLFESFAEQIADGEISMFGTPEDDGDPCAISVGSFVKGLPEIVVAGWPVQAGYDGLPGAFDLVDALSAAQRVREVAFRDGEMVSISPDRTVRLVALSNAAGTDEEHEQAAMAISLASAFFDASVPFLQAFIPDGEGRFPGDEGCDPRYARQPILK